MTTVKSYNKRLEALKSERSSFMPVWQELSDYHLAHRGRFLVSDRNKGHKRNTKQYNNTSRLASRTLASGMMAGITSPARPWFRLGTADPALKEKAAVKHWLYEVQQIMYEVYAQSNTYNSLHMLYSELGVFGNGVMGIYDDFDTVIRCRPYTVGSYMLAANGDNEIDTMYREYQISVAQCVKQFGIDNVSHHVKNMWDNGNTESWVDVVHVIEPNDDRDHMSPLATDMAFRSVYYEKGATTEGSNTFLRRSGFPQFPITAPRWDITGEDIYATDCPGMTALGDTKALQLGERRMYQAVDKVSNPPLQGPAALKSKVGSTLRSGEIVWNDANSDGLRSIYENYRPDLGALATVNREAEMRIKRAFYEDLFLMLANSDRRQITAREIAEKHEEKLLMLGPVLERLHSELLDPLIDVTFTKLQRGGVLPPPPPELENMELKVEYVSVLAQAQRLVGVGAIERMAGFSAQLAAVWPGARHKFNAEQSIDEYADALGVPPQTVRSDDEAAALAQAEAQAAAQAQAAEQGQAMAETAKTMSDTSVAEDNALGTVMRNAGLA